MELKSERVHTGCLSVILCLLVTCSGPQAMVLCIGENGHVAIEASDSHCCGRLPRTTSHTSMLTFSETGSSAKNDDCGPCLDIPISSGLVEAIKAPKNTPPDVPALIELEPAAVACACFSEFHRDLKFLILPSYFTPLDAIVLLI